MLKIEFVQEDPEPDATTLYVLPWLVKEHLKCSGQGLGPKNSRTVNAFKGISSFHLYFFFISHLEHIYIRFKFDLYHILLYSHII